jgi:zeaxanthin glucosyltransferase
VGITRVGLFCFLGRGHLDPGAALGRGLAARGYEVTVFHLLIAQAAVKAAGLQFCPLDKNERPAPPAAPSPLDRLIKSRATIAALKAHAERTLRDAPDAIRAAGIDALVADQLDVAAGSVAERLGLPFITVCCAPPTVLDAAVPPPYIGWPYAANAAARARNRLANALVRMRVKPVLDVINARRRSWNLPPLRGIEETWSTRLIVTQLPDVLEFPAASVRQRVAYTGPFRDRHETRSVPFPWDRLDGRPLIYASMGTVRNIDARAFRIIAEACAGTGMQLVLSLGGGALLPEQLGGMPGDPLVVHYAPQRALLRRAALVINAAGLNTSLDAIEHGVPIIAIPVAEDQPGVAARLRRANLAIVIPYRRLSVRRLRAAIGAIRTAATFRDAVRSCQTSLNQVDGVREAVRLITGCLGPPAARSHAALSAASAPLAAARAHPED